MPGGSSGQIGRSTTNRPDVVHDRPTSWTSDDPLPGGYVRGFVQSAFAGTTCWDPSSSGWDGPEHPMKDRTTDPLP